MSKRPEIPWRSCRWSTCRADGKCCSRSTSQCCFENGWEQPAPEPKPSIKRPEQPWKECLFLACRTQQKCLACSLEECGSPAIDYQAVLAAGFQPVPAKLPDDSDARKGIPLWSGLFAYFPDALAEVARLSKTGNDKHNPGQPLHWSRDKSTDHEDCLLRHQLDAGKMDSDGHLHDVKVAWRALAQLQLALEKLKRG